MATQSDVRPVIIKRKKIISGGGHHGGAWKIAYADFVTAMMAFFLLMWLITSTTEQQRAGIAEYFNPTIPLNHQSGGGVAFFGGDSVLKENILSNTGLGGLPTPLTGSPNLSDAAVASQALEKSLAKIEDLLIGGGGESFLDDNLKRHVLTRVTDEGLVIELFGSDTDPLFAPASSTPRALLVDLMGVVAEASNLVSNGVAVEGHVRSEPLILRESQVWSLSSERANMARILLEASGVSPRRVSRVTGHADRERISNIPRDMRNNRLEIILLRSDG